MAPDNFQEAWQAHASQTRVKVYADLLLKEVQREQRIHQVKSFRAKCLAVGMVVLSLPVWLYFFAAWYLAVPVMVWVTVLEVVFIWECRHRFSRHSQKPHESSESLFHFVKESLNQVEQEISAARIVFWWVVLPASISFLAFMIFFGSQSPQRDSSLSIFDLRSVVIVLPILLYFLSQYSVRFRIEPRRQELLKLLASLSDEVTESNSQKLPQLNTESALSVARSAPVSPRHSPLTSLQGDRPMNNKRLIDISLVVVFLAANIAILYMFRGRFSSSHAVSTFAEAVERGSKAFQKADYDAAIVAWDEAIRIDPNHSEAHRWRGDASMNKYDFDKALAEYDESIRLDPQNAMAYLCRGIVWTEKGDVDKANSALRYAIRLDPSLAKKATYKRYAAAAESLPVTPPDPKFTEAVQRGAIAFEKRDYDAAIVAWDEAIRLNPNHSEVHRWRGDASMNKYDFDEALSEYDEALRLDPKNGMAFMCRGMGWTEKGESDQAITAFDEAIRLNSKLAFNPTYKRYRTAAEALRSAKQSSPPK